MNISSLFRFYLTHTLIFLLLFLVGRILLICLSNIAFASLGVNEIVGSLFAGWKLDLSVVSYLFIIPLLFIIARTFLNHRVIELTIQYYYTIVFFLVSVILFGNLLVFKNWGILLNNRAITFLNDPQGIFASLSNMQILFFSFTILLLLFISGLTGKKTLFAVFRNISPPFNRKHYVSLLLLVLIQVPLLRGGFQQIPVNESAAYFSQDSRLNQVAVNGIWHLANSLRMSSDDNQNPYHFFDDLVAEKLVSDLYLPSEKNELIFDTGDKPNVVFFILESWTADIIYPIGGDKNVTPFFTTLCDSGLLFTNVYSSGFRTDQGMVSILSGYPAQPNKSIIRFPDKTAKLPSITAVLKKHNYDCSFYYGGEPEFANMKSYLLGTGFQHIISKEDFPASGMNSKWGAHDGLVLQRQALDLNQKPTPFFSVLLTLSTHEPFEVPVETPFTGTAEPELFKKSAWYTDQSLAAYFNQVKKELWFKNTIFVFVADHGHRLPLQRSYHEPAIRHIPLLIFGAPLAHQYRGKVIDNLSGQHDIAATLLKQLGYDASAFEWSNDILNKNRVNFSYQNLDDAVLWVTPEDTLIVPLSQRPEKTNSEGKAAENAAAFVQQLYGDFLNR